MTTTIDQCVYCHRSTAFGSGNGLFVNRIPVDDGWGCAECSGFECDECGEQIYLDSEVRVEGYDEGKYLYGNYHHATTEQNTATQVMVSYERHTRGYCPVRCSCRGIGH